MKRTAIIFNGPPLGTDKPWSIIVHNEANKPAEILIQGNIGRNWYDDGGLAEKEFTDALNTFPVGTKIIVGINSQGGSVKDGLGMYNAIKRRRADITTRIDGYALSIASIVALGGEKVVSPKSSVWMIHEPWSMTQGNAEDHRRASDMLEQHGKMLADIYAEETGQSVSAAREAMKQETWFRGKEAIDWGLATDESDQDVTLNAIDFSSFRRVPAAILNLTQNPAAPTNSARATPNKGDIMRDKLIALLKKHGITVAADISDEALQALVDETLAQRNQTNQPNPALDALTQQVATLAAINQTERKQRIEAAVQAEVDNCRIPVAQKDNWVKRALADETVLNDLRALPQNKPGVASVSNVVVLADDIKTIGNAVLAKRGMDRALLFAETQNGISNFDRLMKVVLNTNTIDSNLQQSVIMADLVRAFARPLLPLRVFSTVFQSVPLKGDDTVDIPYFALETAASTNFNGTYSTGNTAASIATITINKRKYQGLSFTSSEFRRQPYLNTRQAMILKAEKLACDVFDDVVSAITNAHFGAAAVTEAAAAFDVDEIRELKKVCDVANWPRSGRALVLDSTYDQYLMGDARLGLANYGQAGAITEGRVPRIAGFDYYDIPNLPSNSENLVGFACFPSALGVVLSPVEPAPDVKTILAAYETATDPATGITLEYRRWGTAGTDTAAEVVEANYGYDAIETAALKRITSA